MQDIVGIVLAGGRARRMGGGDKGLIVLDDKPLVAHAVNRLTPQVTQVVINANRHRQQYAAFAEQVVGDVIGDYPGPLAGIHAGMCAAKCDWVLSVPCDSPFFPHDLAKRLYAAAAADNADVAVAKAGGRTQPVFMLARRCLADDIAATLAGGDGKIDRWFARLKHVVVEFDEAAAFDNINTPEELSAAQRRLSA